MHNSKLPNIRTVLLPTVYTKEKWHTVNLRVSYGCHKILKSTSLDCSNVQGGGATMELVITDSWFCCDNC